MQLVWNGWYFDGRTARRHAAEVEVRPSELRLTLEGGTALRWSYEELRQTQGSRPGEPVRLERGPDPAETLVVEDHSFVAALQEIAPAFASRFTRPVQTKRRDLWLMGAGFLALLALLAAYFRGMPVLAARVAAKIPPAWEAKLGERLVASVVSTERVCRHPEIASAVEAIVQRLVGGEAYPYRFQVTVADVPIVNAFAAPGGYIVVYRGLLQDTESPEELAGVLAHEMQHVIQQHGTRSVLRTVPLRLMLAGLVGDMEFLENLMGTAATAAALRFNREDESSADREGMLMLQRAGVDPQGMVRLFRKMSQESGSIPKWTEYLLTHPHPEERLRQVERISGGFRGEIRPLPGAAQWARLREIC